MDTHDPQPPRLLDQVRAAIHTRQYSPRTEETYVDWIRRYMLYHAKRHPSSMAEPEVRAFPTHLAVDRHIAASMQNQALAELEWA